MRIISDMLVLCMSHTVTVAAAGDSKSIIIMAYPWQVLLPPTVTQQTRRRFTVIVTDELDSNNLKA